MDDDLQTLETELKRLRPTRPAPGLLRRIETNLATNPRVAPRLRWFWAVALPAAATAVFIVQFWRQPEPAAETTELARARAAVSADPGFKPVALENVLYAAEDEGIITLQDGTPAHRARLHYVDTITWRNPTTNASLKWSVPRDEVRVVPVSFQ